MRAGVGSVIITPPLPVQLAGHKGRRIATNINDDLKSKAIVFEDADRRVAMVSVDLLWLDREQIHHIRQLIESETGIPSQNILIACTHTHSGPDTLDWYEFAPLVDRNWLYVLSRQIAGSAYIAANALEPAKTQHGKTLVKIGWNRRLQTERGVERHPNPAGFADHSLDVLSIIRANGTFIGNIIRHNTHPVVLGSDSLSISRDWCGCATDVVEDSVGGCCLYFSGACGDVNPICWTNSTVAEMTRLGKQVGYAAVECALRQGIQHESGIYSLSRECKAEEHPHPYLKKAQHKRIERDGGMKLEVHVVRTGPCLWVGLPGECLGATAKAIISAARSPRVLPISFANDYAGYLPPKTVVQEGGYEARTRMVSVSGLEEVVVVARSLVKEVAKIDKAQS
jgi:hypothetical protein